LIRDSVIDADLKGIPTAAAAYREMLRVERAR